RLAESLFDEDARERHEDRCERNEPEVGWREQATEHENREERSDARPPAVDDDPSDGARGGAPERLRRGRRACAGCRDGRQLHVWSARALISDESRVISRPPDAVARLEVSRPSLGARLCR